MPAIVRTEFALALNQVATERGIDISVVLETIKGAIRAAYLKDYGEDLTEEDEIVVELNDKTGEAKILKEGKDITPPGFGRIAAQTAKQVILQRIREEEKSAILSDYASRVGSIVNGMILRFDGPNIIVDIGRAQGIMPPSEQIRIEQYRINQRLTFYIKEIREGRRGSEIILSRADAQLVAGLFRREVPEVANDAVEIKTIAREGGSRTKIAVHSDQAGVDPVGSCVGQKGVRVQAVINEIGQDEKIDVIQWNPDPIQFITAALAPAKDLVITINEEEKQALVLVPEDQLSLAIGRGGQNVRLASKLSGYIIDIRSKEDPDGTKKEARQKAEAEAKKAQTSEKTAESTENEPEEKTKSKTTSKKKAEPTKEAEKEPDVKEEAESEKSDSKSENS
ncbi:transcription termination factor NusA [Candidatus Roizmanbacteria bacterium]|nr:transcription termination factor NusA [Candidatus Roizmanbacteria bacterium]